MKQSNNYMFAVSLKTIVLVCFSRICQSGGGFLCDATTWNLFFVLMSYATWLAGISRLGVISGELTLRRPTVTFI